VIAEELFAREALVAARLGGGAGAQVYDFARDDRVGPFIAMELLDGEPLDARVARKGALPLDEVLAIGDATLAALEAVHAAGVVHRDIKPSNLFVVRGGHAVKILDFGVACSPSDAVVDHGVRGLFGTPRYMAREQAFLDEDVDARADLHGVGATLYAALAGEPPHADKQRSALMAAVRDGVAPAPLEARRPDLPPAVCAVVARAMAPCRRERFPDAASMRRALAAAAHAV
jgi:serine/threonine-protein kinase